MPLDGVRTREILEGHALALVWDVREDGAIEVCGSSSLPPQEDRDQALLAAAAFLRMVATTGPIARDTLAHKAEQGSWAQFLESAAAELASTEDHVSQGSFIAMFLTLLVEAEHHDFNWTEVIRASVLRQSELTL